MKNMGTYLWTPTIAVLQRLFQEHTPNTAMNMIGVAQHG
ncbi:hypothetical protein JCM19233_407 [Vibrio astriarenae]|nr:hypothetical protein JCM19233_407 [Vibrio sp. C7]